MKISTGYSSLSIKVVMRISVSPVLSLITIND
jgi:hypothetical protein